LADAFLDRAPLLALTGQSGLERMHQESHQHIDVIGILRPIVKWNARVRQPGDSPGGRKPGPRQAGRVDYSIDVAISEQLGAETVAT
jgi:hypothetical protein